MKQLFSVLCLLAVPTVAAAATSVTTNSLEDIITIVIDLFVKHLNPVLVMLALLVFFWGIAMFVWNAGNEKKREEGRNIMIWGIIAFFVMLSIVGIIAILQSTFSLGGTTTIPVPSANSADYNLGR